MQPWIIESPLLTKQPINKTRTSLEMSSYKYLAAIKLLGWFRSSWPNERCFHCARGAYLIQCHGFNRCAVNLLSCPLTVSKTSSLSPFNLPTRPCLRPPVLYDSLTRDFFLPHGFGE